MPSDFFDRREPGTGKFGALSRIIDELRLGDDRVSQENPFAGIGPAEFSPAQETPGGGVAPVPGTMSKGLEEFIRRTPEALAGAGGARVGVHPSFSRIGKLDDLIAGIRKGIADSKAAATPKSIPKPRPENPLRPKPKVPGPKPKKAKDPFKELEKALDTLEKAFKPGSKLEKLLK